nr:putative tail fiber [uncultured Mediterranean phage uvMED]
MTISSTTVKNSYSGNGSNDTFVYGFKIFANTDLQVIIRSAAGTETTKTLTTHYTVTGVGSASGGNVVFTSGNIPTATETVVLIRNVPQTQAIDYIANDPFPAETHEEGLDRATMTTQQVQEELNRSIKLSRTNTMTSTEFTVGATERANKILAFDSAGEISVTQELGTYQGTDATVTTEAYVVRDIVKSTTTAQLNNVYICIANSVVGDSLTDTDHFELLVDAVSAATSATAAATSATASATSATASATSATASANSATAAATSATNAATSETNAAASFDSFDDRYLGAKSSDPSVDNDGNALLTGALYFNSSDNVMKNYTGSAWETLKPSSSEQTNINTLAAADVVADMAILATADIVADMNTLGTADVVSDMNTLATADVVSDMNTLATADVVADMNTLGTADVVADMNTLGTADVVTDMNTLGTATNVTNMATVAANITGVNSFAERYRVASSDPTSSLDEGDLAFNTTDNNLKFYNGTSWTAISPGIANVVDDSTPQLGGNLDVQTNSIVTTSNRNVLLAPNGTGLVEIKGNDNAGQIQLNCEQNSHGVKIKGPPHSAGQSYTLTLPSSITNDYYLKTDGSGNLAFAAVPTETKPTVADVSQTIAPATATTINITGANFVTVPIVDFINASTGAITRANTVSFTNSTTLSVNLTLASGNYFVRIENPDGNAGRSTNNIITASTAPSFSTAAGSLGTIAAGSSVSLSVAASSDSNVTITETTAVLTSNANTPAGTMNLTLSGTPATSATYNITGTAPSPTSQTTYNFTLRATDVEGQTADRAFSITVSVGINNSGQFN